MRFGLYIGNHPIKKGLEDYIETIRSTFLSKNLNIDIINEINQDIDVLLIIENFTENKRELKNKLSSYKRLGKKIFLIHTEFINKNGYFNIFTKKDLVFRRLIANRLFFHLYEKKDKLLFRGLLYCFYAFYLILGFLIGFRFLDIKKRMYFALRDISFKEIYSIFDYHLSFGDNIYSCLRENLFLDNLFYIQPILDEKFIEKILLKSGVCNIFYLSGYKTHFRNKFVKNIKKTKFSHFYNKNNIKTFNINKSLIRKPEEEFNFLYSDEDSIKRFFIKYESLKKIPPLGFELYVSQREGWKYKSPMRTIRAFRNSSIPVNVGNYLESNFDEVTINIKSIHSLIKNKNYILENYLENIKFKIENFNEYSKETVNIFFKEVDLN